MWRWRYTLLCTLVGACFGYVAMTYAPILKTVGEHVEE
jgi:hypothetical protein